MSNLLFDNEEVMNIVVTTVIGEHAKNTYYSSPTNWSNKSASQLVYLSQSGELPPIIIEIQQNVDVDYYLSLISSGVSAVRQYNAPPILITFAMNAMKYEVSKRTAPQTLKPFLWQIKHSQPWARRCYFITMDSIRQGLAREPLDKFVALSYFLLSQCHSISENPYHFDPTIKQLYDITKPVPENQDNEVQKQAVEDLTYVCDKAVKKLEEVIVTLDTSEASLEIKNTIKKSLKDVILLNNAYRAKYERPSYLDFPSSRSSSPIIVNVSPKNALSSSRNVPIKITPPSQTKAAKNRNENWDYLEKNLSKHEKREPIPWEAIFIKGKRDGVFDNYTNSNSLRASYLRWKKLASNK